jgi:hypothetical protein
MRFCGGALAAVTAERSAYGMRLSHDFMSSDAGVFAPEEINREPLVLNYLLVTFMRC